MSKYLRGQRSVVGILFVATLALTGCGKQIGPIGANQPAPGNQSAAPAPSTAAPATTTPSSNAGQVVISGAVNKTYTPVNVEAGTLGSSMIINLHENSTDGISLAFPPDTQPGTYTIQDSSHHAVVDFSGQYSSFSSDAFYLSTKGTLTLTAVGSKFSGQFQFSATHNKDASKTIDVSGSFTDVPVSSS